MGLHPIFQGVTDSFMPPAEAERAGDVAQLFSLGLGKHLAEKQGQTLIQTLAEAGGWVPPALDTERYRMLDAAMAAIGTPWSSGPRETDCFDGWTLARRCAAYATQRDCMDLIRSIPGVSEDAARMAFLQWGLTETRTRHVEPGDVLLLKYEGAYLPAIVSEPGGEFSWSFLPGRSKSEAKIITAYPCRAVTECWFGPFWQDRLVAAFSFETPGAPRLGLAKAA